MTLLYNTDVMHYEIPKLSPKNFETTRGISKVVNDLHDLIYGHYPALLITAVDRVKLGHGTRADIHAMRVALGELGFNPTDRRQEDWGIIRVDEGWHIDRQQEGTQHGHFYPNIDYVTLRRHTAIRGIARASFRTTLFAPHGISGFKHDPAAKTYERLQQPGDTIYFISSGALHDGYELPQAEHRFTTVGTIPRRIEVIDFDFAPK